MKKAFQFLSQLILFVSILVVSNLSFAQTIVDIRNLPDPPTGCEIGLTVDTLDNCTNDNSIVVEIFQSIGCGPYILDYGDGTVITTNNQFNYHNYCNVGNYVITVLYANYFTRKVPFINWHVTNTTFSVSFAPFVDSTCFPATFSFVNTSSCIAPEIDTNGRTINFVWDYGDGSPLDTAYDGGHMYFDKSNKNYSVRLIARINNCSLSGAQSNTITIPWTKISSSFYHLDPAFSYKYICENRNDTSIYFPNHCNYDFKWRPGNLVHDSTSNEPIFLGSKIGCITKLIQTLSVDISSNGVFLYSESFTYNVLSNMTELYTANLPTQVLCAGVPQLINPYKLPRCGKAMYYNWIPHIAGDSEDIYRLITLGDSNSNTYLSEEYTCNVYAFPCSDTSFTQKFLVLGKELPPNFTNSYNTDGTVTFRVSNPYGSNSHTYTWDFGGGRIETGSVITLNNLSGSYVVKLIVTNTCGYTNYTEKQLDFLPSFNAINYNKNQCTQNNNLINYTKLSDDTISVDDTWETPNRKYKGVITIESGITLTIRNCTVQFGMNSKIIVKRGGRLIIQNAILRGIYTPIGVGDTCKGMWQGIEVWGNSYYNHYSDLSVHGKVTISGNSQILDAHKAIFLGKRVTCVPTETEFCTGTSGYIDYEPNYGGGIVDVQGCTFRRNAMDIIFTPYIPNVGNPNTNANRIRNNNFFGGKVLDPGYNTNNSVGAIPYPNSANHFYANANRQGKTSYQIKMYKVYNLGIYGNKFENAVCGINVIDSKFTASKIGTGNGNSFQNLDYGIHSQYTLSGINYPEVISENNFNKIKSAAIRMEGGRIIIINKNNFGKSTAPLSTHIDNPRGIYLFGVSNFNIYDNNFYRLDTSIFILESGIEGGKISSNQQGNIFTQCKQGVMTSGNNQNLQIRCNISLNNTEIDYINKNWNIAGVLSNQGSNIDHTSPAGNEMRPATRKHYFSSTPFYYYAHARAVDSSFATIPTIASGSVGWDSTHIQNTGFVKTSTSCIPPPPCYPNCNIALNLNAQRRDQLINNYESVLESLDGFGNTEALLNSFSSFTSTSTALRTELIENSPLSSTVLDAILNNTQKFTEQDLVDVLSVNLPMEETLWNDLSEYLFPIISNNSVILLKSLQYGESEYATLTSIEQQYINELNNQQQILEEIVINEIAEETPEQAEQKLANETNANKQTAVAGYLAKGDYLNAYNIVQNLSSENDADQDWLNFINIPLGLSQNNPLEWYNLSSTQLESISSFAQSSNSPKALINSRAILKLLYGTEFPMMEQDHNWNFSRKVPRLMELQLIKKQVLQNPYPNPANNEINIPYFSTSADNYIIITDLLGKELKRLPTQKGSQIIQLNLDILSSGMYLVSLLEKNEKKVLVKKFVVQK